MELTGEDIFEAYKRSSEEFGYSGPQESDKADCIMAEMLNEKFRLGEEITGKIIREIFKAFDFESMIPDWDVDDDIKSKKHDENI